MPENKIEDVKKSIETSRCDTSCRELLQFLSRHPYTRFNQLALLNLLGFENIAKTEMALSYLVKIGFVETNQTYALFCLTRNEPIHNMLKSEFALEGTPTSARKWPHMTQLVMPLLPCPALTASY
jgi:hypothetical protein